MSHKLNKTFRIFEYSGFVLCVIFLGYAFWLKGKNSDLSISLFLFSIFPIFLIKIIIGIIEKETIFSGMPKSVKLIDQPKLYWFVILTYCVLLILILSLIAINTIY